MAARQGHPGRWRDRALAKRRRDLELRKPGDTVAPRQLEDARRRWRRAVGKLRVSLLLQSRMALRSDLGPHGPSVRAARLGRGRQYRPGARFRIGRGGELAGELRGFPRLWLSPRAL